MNLEVIHTRVFAASLDGGNPCPVVLGADVLDEADMQGLARDFGLDTAFVLRPTTPEADLRVRYFVPHHEMGISGHATIAAVTAALLRGVLRGRQARLQTISGTFDVTYEHAGGAWVVTVEQREPAFGICVAADVAARVLSISAHEVDPSAGPIQVVSVSRGKLLVPLRTGQVLNRLTPDFEALWRLCESIRVSGLYPFCRRPDAPGVHAEARQFPLRAGFPEDAATGVAAAALGAYLVHYDFASAEGHYEFRIAQGYAMGCPSRIDVIADCANGRIIGTALRGTAEVLQSEWTVQPT